MNLKLILLIFCFSSSLLFSQTNLPADFKVTPAATSFDYSAYSWVDAYDSMHNTLALRYPFTEWKAVDWDEKNAVVRPQIIQAQDDNDSIAFTAVLFEYLYQIPDGHIELLGVSDTYKYLKIGGTYGFNMMKVDNGAVLVSYIPEESPAYTAGLRSGDRILKWNAMHIDSVGNCEQLNYFRNYATVEGRLYSRYLMLGRDAIGAAVEVTFQSAQSGEESTVALVAFDDGMELYSIGVLNTAQSPNMDSLVYYTELESDIGYLYIGAETSEGITPEEVMQSPDFIMVQDAISYFNENSIDKLIVDLRFNLGGNDLQAAVMMGLFYEEPSFYEHITASYDDDYEIVYSLFTEPITPLFEGEIVVIVDPNCISTGEGLAMMFKRLPNAKIVSHWGTNGSFGIVDYEPILLPSGLAVSFPQARSLDENYQIQLDSDSMLVGGVCPDEYVPLNAESLKLQWEQFVDVQLEYAINMFNTIEEPSNNVACILYPNPCATHTNIKFDSPLLSDYEFKIVDLNGCLVHQELLVGGSSEYTITLNDICSGIYLYELKNESKTYRGKIVVSN